jgi:choloylglycine hydrolase
LTYFVRFALMEAMVKHLFWFLFAYSSLYACTAFQLRSSDGALVYCRSLEFGFPFQSDALIVPRGVSYTGTAPEGNEGIQWTVKYGFVGLNQTMAPKLVSDGMNERGLVVGCLYLPGFTQYEAASRNQYDRTLGAWELTAYLLSTCATIYDVKLALSEVVVAQEGVPQLNNFMLPVHFIVCDVNGGCLVIEYVAGKRHVHENPLGVLTNSPPFDWHMNHLQQYVNLSAANASTLSLKNSYKVQFAGQGSGLLGLPGDYSPSSRFIRAALFSSFATPPRTALHAVRLGFHLLNTFDIFDGAVKSASLDDKKRLPFGASANETTQWVVVHDLTNKKTYFRSYESLKIEMVDLKAVDFSESTFSLIPMSRDFSVEDITDNAKPFR